MYSIFQFLYHFDIRSFFSKIFETLTFRTRPDDYYNYIQNKNEIIPMTIER